MAGLISKEELGSDPAYLSYYYSNVNLNPRLPPAVLSKEGRRPTQRLSGIGDRRKAGGDGSGLMLNRQPGFENGEANVGCVVSG